MTTPGEELPDEQKLAPRHVNDPLEGMLGGNHYAWIPKTLVAIGVASVAGVGFAAHELTSQGHRATKKSAKSASPFPGRSFVANFDLSELDKVIDEQGRVEGDAAFPNLRADEVAVTAVCEASDRKLFNNQEKTIIIYKANQPKTGFVKASPTVAQQISLEDISRYSQTFPGTFSGEGHIGTENAEALAASVHQNPCVDKGSLWGYKDQQVRPLIPSNETVSPFQPNLVQTGVFLGLLAVVGVAGYGSYRLVTRRLLSSAETTASLYYPDAERVVPTPQDESIISREHDDDRWGFSELDKQ